MPQKHIKDPEKLELVVPAQGKPWGGLNKYDQFSRYTIRDEDADDLINWLPMGPSMKQVPGVGSLMATLPATVVWLSAQVLNGGTYIYAFCSDTNLYQISAPGGVVTQINGLNALNNVTDITNWQGTKILFTDPGTGGGTIFSWDGASFVAVFTSQPANYICVYQGRLFGAFNSTIWFTDANSYNSLSGSAGAFAITDAACALPVLGLVSFQGSLLIFGPNFIQVLSNMYVSGSPPVALFTLYQLESQIGCVNKWSIIPYGASLYFANKDGIWVLNGSVPQFVSQQVDYFFDAFTANSSFSAAYMTIYSMPCLFWNIQYAPDGDSTYTNLGMTANMQWFRTILGSAALPTTITFITSTFINQHPVVWGTDGTRIFSVYTNTTTSVTSTYNSKFWNLGQPLWKKLLQKMGFAMVIGTTATGSLTVYSETGQVLPTSGGSTSAVGSFSNQIQWVNQAGQPIAWVNNSAQPILWVTGGNTSANSYSIWQYNVEGRVQSFGIQFTVTSTAAFFQSVVMQTEWSQAVWGS